MRKRRVLAFFLSMSMLASTVFPAAAAEATGLDKAGNQQILSAEDDASADAKEETLEQPEGATESESSEETTSPEEPEQPSDTVQPGEAAVPEEPEQPADTAQPGETASPEESEQPSDTAQPGETTAPEAPAQSENPGDGTDQGEAPEQPSDPSADSEEEMQKENPEEPELLVTEEEETEEAFAAEATEPACLVDFDFENLTDGSEITSDGAKATGNYTVSTGYLGQGSAIYLDGSADQFLTVTDEEGESLLTGLTELTVSLEVKMDRMDATNWVFYAAPNSSSPSYQKEKYIGFLYDKPTGNFMAERYNNNGARPANPKVSASAEWVHADVVLKEDRTILYINGEKKAEETSSVKIDEMLGENSIFQIGKANWGSGEYCKGWIDNFRVYNYALDADEVKEQYKELSNVNVGVYTGGLTLNAGYVAHDLELPEEYEGAEVVWSSSNPDAISAEGKVTRTDENQDVTLTATITKGEEQPQTKEFQLIVLSKGQDVITYVSNASATGQKGGMKIAMEDGDGYTALHKDQPILYTAKGAKEYVSPQIFRKADGTSFGMVAANGGTGGSILVYDTEDLITYTGERECTLPGINGISKLSCVYDLTEQVYKLFVENGAGTYIVTTKDFETFEQAQEMSYDFAELSGPSDAVWESGAALTQSEFDRVVKKFSNPYNTSLDTSSLPASITVQTGDSEALETELSGVKVKAEYSDGTEKTFSVRYDLDAVNIKRPGTYTVEGTIGGSAYYTEADAPLIEERADPFITYNEDDGYYYFTASYPMDGSSDKDGYDRLILRRAKTISGLADAEEVTIWDEASDPARGRFIWAPELHKIGDSWYFISTAAINSGTGTSFNIRPFMVKCNDSGDMMNPESWGDPVDVKAMPGDTGNCLNAMSLDMTYFEAGGTHYLAWADFTGNRPSSIFIATIDPENPTQLTSKCAVIAIPEYNWEIERFTVNEGPAVIKNDGKVYLAFSASGTGSEYCVGFMIADEDADLTNPESWTKNPYPVLTSADFGDEVSGPGHNSFTVDENGNPVIVYHARPTAAHSSHGGDPLYDPCRHCYVKPVFFDEDGMPILNLSDEEFLGGSSAVSVQVTVSGEDVSDQPILEYNFDEDFAAGTASDSIGENDAELSDGASYVQDEEYGQVLYLDGDTSVGGSNSFLAFPEGFFDGKDELTISMDVKEVTRSGNYFTFTIGQDNNKYLFLKTMPTQLKLAITEGSYGSEKTASKSFVYPNNSRTWINVKMVVTPDSISLYQDGKLVAEKKNTGISMSDLGTELKAYLGKSFYSGDAYFRGYFDNVKVYDWAMTSAEIRDAVKQEETARREAMEEVQHVADSFEIPNADSIKGNITLPSEKNGVSIAWTSGNEAVISTKAVSNEGYDDTPAGVVTRQEEDTSVTLSAEFSKDGKSVTKNYEVTVKAKPQDVTEDDYAGYLFVHFTGTEEDGTKEQTYFSISEDGLNWEDLNNNKAVLNSTIGESGLRDHYIARSAEGDKFYMIATDLSIAHNRSWAEAGANGSHSIVVWESDDLVNWSDPWMAEIAPEGAGCTWAPEFIYDEKTGEYVVYWSATTLKVDENEKITEEYENHAIYYCKTRDFRNFTEAKLYHKGDGVKVIDSTMIEQDGTYYRYTKNESKGIIEIDKSDSVLGTFETIASKTLSTDLMGKVGAVEGPIIFKLNEKTSDGKEQWCLMVDRFAKGQGYYPLITTDLASGEFTMLSDNQFSMPSKYRHGYVMPVTKEEYAALQEKWGDKNYSIQKVLEKSSGNPMLGFDENGDILYGGDPSILVDGDTVYCYVGHDTSTNESYYMPDWRCYSSKDMKTWTYESTILTGNDISWAQDNHQAWAGQVIKGTDGKYYFYYCTEEKGSPGKSIGAAVSDSPTGPFKDIGAPLVSDTVTQNGTVHAWEDIDPTFWQETDENGETHRYLGWGNTRFFVCELNEDYISVKDRDGKAGISTGYAADGTYDIVIGTIDGHRNWEKSGDNHLYFNGEDGEHYYTEAPYYYRQQDENGNYYGPYYMFFACDWREQMAYATTDDIMSNEWTFGGVIMEPSATGNTNHMAVFDFKGETYFVYHDGSLPHGSGFRRVACVEKFEINSDGSIDPIKKTAVGLTGTISKIKDSEGSYVAIKDFENVLDDSFYPIKGKEVLVDFYESGEVAEWEINPGKANPKKDSYVSIESNMKPGLYLTAGDPDADGTIKVVLSQDSGGTQDEALRMTFRTLEGASGDGVTFESVKYPGYYMVSRDGKLLLTENPEGAEAVFYVSTDEAVRKPEQDRANRDVLKKVRFYTAGETMKTDDIRIQLYLDNGTTKQIEDYTTNAEEVDLSTAGEKTLKVFYEFRGVEYTDSIQIHVVDAGYRQQ